MDNSNNVNDFLEMLDIQMKQGIEDTKKDFGVTIVEESIVDISNKNKADVLATLHNNARFIRGIMLSLTKEEKNKIMTTEEAQAILDSGVEEFDILKGKYMSISLEDEQKVDIREYNRYNGENAAETAIATCPNKEMQEDVQIGDE
ncbi:MAG: hypothetical protein A2Y24_06880 [Clostridiales bacterium GWE2_32_10]|nr:MAG: hypothetical protein A2Y24_06880 [Clostridiales bacterium GWE2_32_10]HBY19977.1 hypothetical protein [Clostridiales bacterium]